MQSLKLIQRRMKFKVLVPLLVVLLGTASVQAATINFDENGNGTIQTGGATIPLTSLGNQTDPVDPANGLKPLIYDLAGSLGLPPALFPTPGDINLFEPVTGQLIQTDVVRFTPTGLLVVYSDRAEAGETPIPLADVGFSTTGVGQPNSLLMFETGPEAGPNGMFNYTPNPPGDPGSMAAAVGPVTYNFLSDPQPVPEPRSMALIGLSAASLFLRRRR